MELVLERFCAGYGAVTIVDGLSLRVAEGEAVVILGRNGMGKSTLLKGILGFLPGARGSVRLGGKEIIGRPTNAIVRCGVAYAGQEGAIFGELTVEENIDAGTLISHPGKLREKQIFDFFPVLKERRQQRAGTLSGGEQRMLALARVLLASPKLIVLDEISAGLQPAKVAEVESALQWERRNRGTTILMVEQNLSLAMSLASRIAVMKVGQIALEARSDAVGIKSELMRQLAP